MSRFYYREAFLSDLLNVELIIPSYNRLPILLNTFKSIRILYPSLKICLGIQGERSITDYSKELNNDPNLRIELLSVPSLTGTLNHCIRNSKADIILILDDDAIPFLGWAEAHVAAFRNNENLVFTAGREVRVKKKRTAFSELIRILVGFIFGLFFSSDNKLNGRIIGWTSRIGLIFGNFDQPGTCKINTPRGCNMAVRRDRFLEIGGFNEAFRGNAWGNEADLGIRMGQGSKYGLYIGDALAIHKEVETGGCRDSNKQQGFKDYLHNHKLLIANLGPQAWIGSLPRLAKKAVWLIAK